ncbi:MAG: hypothetical protein V3S62_01550 [Acidimicrobiia bacterium]
MQYGLHMNELADALASDRDSQLAESRLAAAANDRAGPDITIRRRLGRRLITIGERIAYGRSQVATR